MVVEQEVVQGGVMEEEVVQRFVGATWAYNLASRRLVLPGMRRQSC